MIAKRVTTAVLLLFAGIVSPGVCDACPQTGCNRGAAASNSATDCPACNATGTAAVADSGCHGKPFSGQPRGGMEAGDGPSNTCDTCRCMLAPRDSGEQSLPSTALVRLTDAAVALPAETASLPAGLTRATASDRFSGSLLPSRPFRVLYGVWRN